MAKKCIFCGQLLTQDDDSFCNSCGRFQVPLSDSASPKPAPIRVKLPPKEFSRFDSPAAQHEGDLPVWPPEGARTFQREQPAGQSSRMAKRPVRLTPQESSARVEQAEIKDALTPASLSDAGPTQAESPRPTPVEEISTMVLPGWREELELLRKKRSAASPVPPIKSPDSPIQSATGAPQQPQSVLHPSQQTISEERAEKEGFAAPGLDSQPSENRAGPTEPLRRELRVKVWEQEPTIHHPQVHSEKPEPAPAVEHTPFAEILLGPNEDEKVEHLADVATVHWQALSEPLPAQESQEQTEEEEGSEQTGESDSQVIEEFEKEEHTNKVEDQPTLPLVLREPEKSKAQITIERASTPAPRNWASAKNEEIEDLPTRPMAAASPAGPFSSLPPVAQQSAQSDDSAQLEVRPAPLSKTSNPPSSPGLYSPALADPPTNISLPGQNSVFPLAFPERTANPPSQPGQPFNPPSLPPLPRNPASLPGNTVLRPEEQSVQQRQQSMLSDPFARHPSPFAPPSPLPNTPRPDAAAVDAALAKPRQQRKRVSRVLVFVLILLLVGGGVGSYVLYYQLSSAPAITQPTQTYQNSAFGISLSYPQHWSVHVDQARNTLSFADSTSTGQITLSMAPANGQLSQYLTQKTSQLRMIGLKTEPAITFAGSSWQQEQGTVTQRGATYTITLYVTQHNSHFYALAFLAPPPAYAQMNQDDFAPLRASFSFQ